MTATPYILRAPCRFLKTYDEIIAAAAQIGRNEGRDADWIPSCLDAALLEILLFSHSASTSGVVFLALPADADTVHHARIPLELDWKADRIRHHGLPYLPIGWPDNLGNALIALLNSGESPADFGVRLMTVITDLQVITSVSKSARR